MLFVYLCLFFGYSFLCLSFSYIFCCCIDLRRIMLNIVLEWYRLPSCDARLFDLVLYRCRSASSTRESKYRARASFRRPRTYTFTFVHRVCRRYHAVKPISSSYRFTVQEQTNHSLRSPRS